MKIYNAANLNSENSENSDAAMPRDEDALFAAWNEDRQARAPRSLREWVNRYPQYAPSLVAWAADMPLLECALESAAPDRSAEARTLAVGRQALAEMRAQYFAAQPEAAPAPAIDNLLQTAKTQGLTAGKLAARLNVGLPLVAKLNQRLVRLATIPQPLLQGLADELHTGVEQVRAYLARPATLAASAQYKADGIPQVSAPEDFADAIRACTDMTGDQKQFWLEQE